jgi:hypothetical protein
MSVRTKLLGVAASGALAVVGAAVVAPGTASAFPVRPTLSISGVEGPNSVGACTGGFCSAFNQLVSLSAPGDAVTFTAAQTGMSEPLRVIAEDTLTCQAAHAENVYTYQHNTTFGTATLTFQPDLTCPSIGQYQYPIASEQSAQAQAETGVTTPSAGLVWYDQLQ